MTSTVLSNFVLKHSSKLLLIKFDANKLATDEIPNWIRAINAMNVIYGCNILTKMHICMYVCVCALTCIHILVVVEIYGYTCMYSKSSRLKSPYWVHATKSLAAHCT